MKKLLLIILVFALPTACLAQTKNKTKQNTTEKSSSTDCEKAQQKLEEAHIKIEMKQHWVAEQLLKEALSLCGSEELKYNYELAWDYYLMKE